MKTRCLIVLQWVSQDVPMTVSVRSGIETDFGAYIDSSCTASFTFTIVSLRPCNDSRCSDVRVFCSLNVNVLSMGHVCAVSHVACI